MSTAGDFKIEIEPRRRNDGYIELTSASSASSATPDPVFAPPPAPEIKIEAGSASLEIPVTVEIKKDVSPEKMLKILNDLAANNTIVTLIIDPHVLKMCFAQKDTRDQFAIIWNKLWKENKKIKFLELGISDENCRLNNGQIKMIVEPLQQNQSLERIDLAGHDLKPTMDSSACLTAVAKLAQANPNLVIINLDKTGINGVALIKLFTALQKGRKQDSARPLTLVIDDLVYQQRKVVDDKTKDIYAASINLLNQTNVSLRVGKCSLEIKDAADAKDQGAASSYGKALGQFLKQLEMCRDPNQCENYVEAIISVLNEVLTIGLQQIDKIFGHLNKPVYNNVRSLLSDVSNQKSLSELNDQLIRIHDGLVDAAPNCCMACWNKNSNDNRKVAISIIDDLILTLDNFLPTNNCFPGINDGVRQQIENVVIAQIASVAAQFKQYEPDNNVGLNKESKLALI